MWYENTVLSTGDIITGPANYCSLLPILLSEGKDFEARENKDVFHPSSTSPWSLSTELTPGLRISAFRGNFWYFSSIFLSHVFCFHILRKLLPSDKAN